MASAGRGQRLSAEHKSALVEGRAQARIVRDYLTALKSQRGKPGRKRTIESVRRRLAVVEDLLTNESRMEEDPIQMLELLQERLDLNVELVQFAARGDLASLEQQFLTIAESFGRRKGITYEVWRQMRVPASVLRNAGIHSGAA